MTNKIHLFTVITIIFSVLFILSSVVKAEDAHFIYPGKKTVLSVSKIRVIGKTGDSKNLSLSVVNRAGKRKYELIQADNYFYREVQLKGGKNTISLSTGSGTADSVEIILADKDPDPSYPEDFSPYYLHSKNDLADQCELCHLRDQNNTIQYKEVQQQSTCITDACHAGFDKGKFLHGVLKEEGPCVKCHNPHGSENKDFLKHFGGNLCFSCHTDAERMVGEAEYVHSPVKKKECTSCHDPHKSDHEYHLKKGSIVNLCEGCHGKDNTSHKVLHTPVKAGDCNVCHTPHVSKHKALLVEIGTGLCIRCHKVRQEEFKSKHVHEPVKKDCTNCHDPHGSATIYHLHNRKDEDGNDVPSDKPFTDLCLTCHRKLDPELVDQIENAKVTHEPVVKDKCTVCHTPHSTNYKKQLKAPLKEICFSCHQKMKELIEGSMYKHGPIHSSDCAQCHQAHGSDNRKLLRAQFSKKYTDKFNMDNFTLCFNCHGQDMILKKNALSTDFRNGRKNLHYVHVNDKKKSRNCISCHDIHASDQEKHIREEIPYEGGFTVTIEFTKTPTGGGCIVGCHKPKSYDRKKPIKNK
jgi:predicted CXXCH cytochrome family protein